MPTPLPRDFLFGTSTASYQIEGGVSALQAKGGWMARETAERFGDYAALVADRLADRVAMWIPVNEPVVATLFGHAIGLHAPGESRGFEALAAAHHLLLGHGLATRSLRAEGVAAIGTANNHTPASTPTAWVTGCPARSPRT